ncbi:hypothetical protein GDO86_013765 [Hymenochirus boettgeri]|uniref:Uncharacterized protein n=1 Tax=Hymenochirus boettgeri TaxID=247094 RepID=A0A8T2JP21_9PIPI|nr:hypothetical protein GDO86_013765 [Hymenochirus boettgeri]
MYGTTQTLPRSGRPVKPGSRHPRRKPGVLKEDSVSMGVNRDCVPSPETICLSDDEIQEISITDDMLASVGTESYIPVCLVDVDAESNISLSCKDHDQEGESNGGLHAPLQIPYHSSHQSYARKAMV